MNQAQHPTDWIWTEDWTVEDQLQSRIIYFRKTFSLDRETIRTKQLRISADSRYKLYVNGCFVQEGPQKALSLREWYADPADIAPYLHPGENVIAAEVMRYPAYIPRTSNVNDSLLRTEQPNLYIEDRAPGNGADLSGKSGWKSAVNRSIRIFGENTQPAPIHVQENARGDVFFSRWKLPGYDDSHWRAARPYSWYDIPQADAPGCLTDRTIPPMYHENRRFTAIACVREDGGDPRFLAEAEAWLCGKAKLVIPPHTRRIIELSAGEEQCGYLLYSLGGGGEAQITTLCSECYAYPVGDGKPVLKGDRTDAQGGCLCGHTSYYTVGGFGTEDVPETYEPYWFRTFRYIQLTIVTRDEPLTLFDFSYCATGYPMEVKSDGKTSDPTMKDVWDISVRTLRRCMHETYMDCPFYEQLQYAMDTRAQALFTYAISADDRLARQAMEAFRLAQRPDGLINADAPTQRSNVIPGFSIYYLLMIYDHMMYFGDRELIKRHLTAIEGILMFFNRNLQQNGLVGKIGGLHSQHRYWSFIDWTTKWVSGVPGACLQGTGALTMESLLYLYGLQKTTEIAHYIGYTDLEERCMQRAGALRQAILSQCLGSCGGQQLLQDGPGIELYSVHCQIFAVLTGIVSPKKGRKMLEYAMGNPDIAQSSVAFMFYLFRALEICGWYEKTNDLWELWRKMVRNHLTTCVENDTDARSDCHAWGSLICYELPAVILGVRPVAPRIQRNCLSSSGRYLVQCRRSNYNTQGRDPCIVEKDRGWHHASAI